MFLFSQPFLFGKTAEGARLVSWRVWLLIWLLPVAFALTAAGLGGWTALRYATTLPGEGEVVRVYEWPGETLFDRGRALYGPVFLYQFTPGVMTEASTGMSSPDWNFAIGSRHAIRYSPLSKQDVMLEGRHNWAVAVAIGVIGLGLAVPAFWLHLRVRRWQRGGAKVG